MENIGDMIDNSDYMRDRNVTVRGSMTVTGDIVRIIFSDKRE